MFKYFKKIFQSIQDKKQKKEKLSKLIIELNDLQKHLDHLGKIRGMYGQCNDNKKDFYYTKSKRDDKIIEIEKYKRENKL